MPETETNLALRLKRAEIKEKLNNVASRKVQDADLQAKSQIEKDKLILEKISQLRTTLTAHIFETEGLSGMEQKLIPVFDESEMATIKSKIFELIHKL